MGLFDGQERMLLFENLTLSGVHMLLDEYCQLSKFCSVLASKSVFAFSYFHFLFSFLV